MTGIETASMISRIMRGAAMRATPPSLRMSAGTRSSAITEHAPASSAISACSALVTSMMTPPFSISARPTFTRHTLLFIRSISFLPVPAISAAIIKLVWPGLLLVLLAARRLIRTCYDRRAKSFSIDLDKLPASPSQHNTGRIPNLPLAYPDPLVATSFPAFHNQLFANRHWPAIFHCELTGHGVILLEAAHLSHHLTEQSSNDPAMQKPARALILGSDPELSANTLGRIILLEGEPHAVRIRPAATETAIRWIGRQQHSPSDQRHAPAKFVAHASLPLAQLGFQNITQCLNPARDALFVHTREAQSQCVRLWILQIKVPPGHEVNPALARVD